MAANDSRKSSKRSGGSRSSSASAGARKSASRSRATDDTRKRSAKGAGTAGKATAKKTSSRSAAAGGRSARSGSRSASARKTGAKSAKAAGRAKMDALKLLKQDHEHVDAMFRKYERMKEGDERKQALCSEIIEELRVHAQIEEELFYPALATLFEEEGKDKEKDLINEADVEHESVKWLIEQIEGEQSDEAMRDARVKVLGEYVKHHVKEEEGQIFKAAKKVDLDLDELGRQLDARKRQLMGQEPADQAVGGGSMEVSEPAQMASPASAE